MEIRLGEAQFPGAVEPAGQPVQPAKIYSLANLIAPSFAA